MADRVELSFRSAIERLVPRDVDLLAAVSGGGDSVAMLHLLTQVATSHGIRVTVAHLDHALRAGSANDRRFVERLSERLGLPCISDRAEVSRLRRPDESPEEAARRVRRAFLREAASQGGCRLIATGHTLDDQAETVLMRLVRGAGATALTGMAESGPGPFVRPLLAATRDALRRYLSLRDLEFREDPSNGDLRHDRNRVRALILPTLAAHLNPRAAAHLVRAADRFREDARYLDRLATESLERELSHDRQGRLTVRAAWLAALAPAIGGRVARLAIAAAGADARRISSRHVEALLDLARGGTGRRVDLPGGMIATRSRATLHIGKGARRHRGHAGVAPDRHSG